MTLIYLQTMLGTFKVVDILDKIFMKTFLISKTIGLKVSGNMKRLVNILLGSADLGVG